MECVVQGIIETQKLVTSTLDKKCLSQELYLKRAKQLLFQHVDALEILLQGLCGVPKEQVRIHELCLKSGPNLGVVPSEVRLLCDLVPLMPSWIVRHVGGSLRGPGAEQLSVLVRSVVESKVSSNVLRFFYGLGYKLDHEILKLHATEDAVPITPNIHMVEITSPATAENYNEVVAAVTSFCEYLAPLLHLSKPGVSTGTVPSAAAAAASLMSNSVNRLL